MKAIMAQTYAVPEEWAKNALIELAVVEDLLANRPSA